MDAARLTAIDHSAPWAPQPGPQLDAFVSQADQVLYGGAAGGGKTQLAIGLALTAHRRTLFVRHESSQTLAAIEEVGKVLGSRDGWNGQERVWRLDGGRSIQFGGVQYLGDERRYQGNARDLLVVDEAANVLEIQVRFLCGWVRTEVPGQRCRVLLCSNPPTDSDGEWLIRWFAPWLDPTFVNPARPGELRWVAMLDGVETWVDGPEPIVHKGETIRPFSRTFIPSRVSDNRYYAATDYERQLQALPEPLRSQMLHGNFAAGREDHEWQVIPSAWVKAAMDRWKPVPEAELGEITCVGVDPTRGGKDEAVISRRRGWRFDPLILVSAASASTGGAMAKVVMDHSGDTAPVRVDVIGVGSTTVDHLIPYLGRRVVPVNFAESTESKDASGRMAFANERAAHWWRMREILEPSRVPRVALPKDQRLAADLTAPHYKLTARGIQIEGKDDIKKRLGRSPDRGDATVLAAANVPAVIVDHNARERGVARVNYAEARW